MSQYDPTFDLKINRSWWPIFHGPLILPYILKTIWCMNIILWDNESVWPDIWPQNKSLWPIFHRPVILPFILKTVWCTNIIIWDYESVWPDIWPQNKCMSVWPIFMVQWFCLISPSLFDGWVSYFQIMRQFDPNFDLNKYRSTWPIFHGLVILLNIFKIIWLMNIIVGIMDQCDTEIDLIWL